MDAKYYLDPNGVKQLVKTFFNDLSTKADKNELVYFLKFRRDNDYNFEAIKDTYIPQYNEIVLVDTARDGLRAKVGNGVNTYAELQFTDADLRNAVLHGYLKNGVFYRDNIYSVPYQPMQNKIFIDDATRKIYFHNGTAYQTIQSTFSGASAVEPGLVKLYSTTGQNTDGTMTQKAITDELDLRYKANIDDDNELLIFTLN